MITVNLKPGVRRATEKSSAFAGVGGQFRALGSRVKEPWLLIGVGSWVAAALFLGIVFARTQSQASQLGPQLDATQAEYQRYNTFVMEKRREERVRDSILGQIGTISAVDQDRFIWPHLLSDIAMSLPDFTWVTEVSNVANVPVDPTDSLAPPPVVFRVVGRTTDLANYTAFLRRLEASPWITNVLPVEAKTVLEKNHPLTAFTIQGSFTRADSTHVRTVPILESVVR